MRKKRHFLQLCVFIAASLFLTTAFAAEERISLKDGDLILPKQRKNEEDILEKCLKIEERLEKSGILYEDERLGYYIGRVAHKLLPGGLLCNRKPNFQFKIVRDPTINAFALPTGKIYIHTGLIARLENEAQLAFILSHEISHTINRDAFYFTESAHSKTVSAKLMDLVLSPVSIAFTGIDLSAIGLGFLHATTVTGYSRANEARADLGAIETIERLGYSSKAAVEVFDIFIEEAEKYNRRLEIYFLANHPSNKNRRQSMQDVLLTQDGGGSGTVNEQQYKKIIEDVKLDDVMMNIKLDRYHHALERLDSMPEDFKGSAQRRYYLGEIYRGMFENSKKVMWELSHAGAKKLKETPKEERAEDYFNKAVEEYKAALKIDNLYAEAQRGLGFAYKAKGSYEEAYAGLISYLRMKPDAGDKRFIMSCLIDLKKRMKSEAEEESARQQ